jgi:peptidoglycan/xylan/chitin deacetylase (PgdA/CDA1 family)
MKRGYTAYLLCAILVLYSGPPAGALDFSEAIETHVAVNHGPSTDMYIALTFDDGPKPLTPELLAILDEYGVRATFFICGSVVDVWQAEFDLLCDSGHEIGNHSWSHPHLTRLSEYDIIEQLEPTNDLIEDCSGQRPQLFRPPYGAYNEYVIGAAERMGMATIMWDIDPKDWKDPSPDLIAEYVVSRATSGSIVLLHEGHQNTLTALPIILDTLMAEGYRFITVGEMLGLYPGFARKVRNEIDYPLKPEERGLF